MVRWRQRGGWRRRACVDVASRFVSADPLCDRHGELGGDEPKLVHGGASTVRIGSVFVKRAVSSVLAAGSLLADSAGAGWWLRPLGQVWRCVCNVVGQGSDGLLVVVVSGGGQVEVRSGLRQSRGERHTPRGRGRRCRCAQKLNPVGGRVVSQDGARGRFGLTAREGATGAVHIVWRDMWDGCGDEEIDMVSLVGEPEQIAAERWRASGRIRLPCAPRSVR